MGWVDVGSDGVYLAGQLNGSSLLRKYDFNGNTIWTSPLRGNLGTPYPSGVAVGPNGVYVVGNVISRYDFNGSLVWTHDLENYSGVLNVYAGLGGVYTAGTLCCNSQYVGGLVQKYDFNGNLSWTRKLYDPPMSLCACEVGNMASDGQAIVVTGYYTSPYSTTEGFLRKYDPSGSELWTAQFSSPDHSPIGPTVSANPSGNYLTLYTGAGHTFVMKYDGNGKSVWSFQSQAQPLRAPYSRSIPISVGKDEFYLGGVLRGTIGADAYLAKFSQSSSLIFFGLNPPLSFIILGGLIGGSLASLFFFRRFRRARVRPARVGPNPRSLPTSD
jgi:hypothetical protein